MSDDVQNLIRQFVEAKRQEADATARRVELAAQIATQLGAPDEGSKTHTVGAFKVTVEQPINRRVDWTVFDLVVQEAGGPAPVITKRELDLPGMRWWMENRPEAYRLLAKAITATPGRVAVKIKEVGEK